MIEIGVNDLLCLTVVFDSNYGRLWPEVGKRGVGFDSQGVEQEFRQGSGKGDLRLWKQIRSAI